METKHPDASELFQREVLQSLKTLMTQLEDLSRKFEQHVATCHHHPQNFQKNIGLAAEDQEQSHTGRHRHTIEDHKQTSLRKSIQTNILLLVDNLPFSESELADMLISADCLTEDECADLRRFPARKDQVRNLVRIIKGRSFKVMEDFLCKVKIFNPDIVDSIWASYRENWRGLGTTDGCTFCCLRRSVDIKLLADHLWSVGVMSDGLYDEIVVCVKPDESQWRKIALECNTPENAKRAMGVICDALEKKGHYTELVSKLRRNPKLECCCISEGATASTTEMLVPTIHVVECDPSSTSERSKLNNLTHVGAYGQSNAVHIKMKLLSQPSVEDNYLSTSPRSSTEDEYERSALSDISSQEDIHQL